MNLSGAAVQALMTRHGVRPDDVLLVHDDLDLPLGRVRLKRGGGAGGQRGVQDTIDRVGPAFARLKIGVSRPPTDWPAERWVLSRFDEAELPLLERVVEAAADASSAGSTTVSTPLSASPTASTSRPSRPRSPLTRSVGRLTRPTSVAAAQSTSAARLASMAAINATASSARRRSSATTASGALAVNRSFASLRSCFSSSARASASFLCCRARHAATSTTPSSGSRTVHAGSDRARLGPAGDASSTRARASVSKTSRSAPPRPPRPVPRPPRRAPARRQTRLDAQLPHGAHR
jgi:hypothetical protein